MSKSSDKPPAKLGRPRGAKTKLAFTMRQVERFIKSVRNTGIEVGRIEIIASTGAISVTPAAPAAEKA